MVRVVTLRGVSWRTAVAGRLGTGGAFDAISCSDSSAQLERGGSAVWTAGAAGDMPGPAHTEPTGRLRGAEVATPGASRDAEVTTSCVAAPPVAMPTQSKAVHLCPLTMAPAIEEAGRGAAGEQGAGVAGETGDGLWCRNCCGRPGKYLLTAVFADSRCIGQGIL